MTANFIKFNISIGQQKPETIHNEQNICPFCDREHLTDIIATEGDMILLHNKYNVLENADQFVLIESRDCNKDMPAYSTEYMHQLLQFGIKHWRILLASHKYQDVIFFKNYGIFSGGTLHHPHMQLIGFKDIAINPLSCQESDFLGLTIAQKNGVIFNLSTRPRIGFTEFNIIPDSNAKIDIIADYIQIAIDYIMKYIAKKNKSYNIFFYLINKHIRVKIIPRFATSPLFIGYNIRLCSSNIEMTRQKIQAIYFANKD